MERSLAPSGQKLAELHWLRRLAVGAAMAAAFLVGLLQTVRGWRSLNADGVSYLDLGARLLQSKLTGGYSGYWSPLYAILAAGSAYLAELAGLNRLLGVQALNCVLFVAALAACCWMVREVAVSAGAEPGGWRVAGLQASAASLFTILVIRESGVVLVTPDLLVAALMMAACGLSGAMVARGWPLRHGAAAGLIFGTGYWAKAVFFPIWWWWLVLHAVLGWKQRSALKALGLALAIWIALAAPLLLATSRAVGRLSFGEAGRLNAIWAWNRIASHGFWEGEEEGLGKPANRIRKVLKHPPVYVFGEKFPEATYPIWYAPDYWWQGVRMKATPQGLQLAVASNGARLFEFLKPTSLALVLFLGSLGWAVGRNTPWRTRVATLLFCLAGFGVLLIVFEPRYVLGAATGVWTAGAVGLATPKNGWRRAAGMWIVAMLAVAGAWAFVDAGIAVRSAGPSLVTRIAEELSQVGVPERSDLCWIGPVPGAGEVAWQLRGRVVAQIPAEAYRGWMQAHGVLPVAVEEEFSKAGCRAAVAMLGPEDPPPQGWAKAGTWPVYVRLLGKQPE